MANNKNTRQTVGNVKNSVNNKSQNKAKRSGNGAFYRIVNDKRLMVPITALLSLFVVALIALIVLDSTGILYGYIPDKGKDPIQGTVSDGDREFLDGNVIKSGQYEYKLYKDGTAELQYYEDNYATEIVVPAEIDGYKVTAIGDECFVWMPYLTSVTVPEGVTYIGVEAFSGCGTLAVLKLPTTLSRIADQAFKDCPSTMTVEYRGDISKVTVGAGNEALLNSINAK